MSLLGIVVALPEELSTLSLQNMPARTLNSLVVICSGAGAENARKAAETLVAQGVNSLISWGCAAALSPDLKSGDLTLADSLLDADGVEMKINSIWHTNTKQLLEKMLPVYSGCLLESREIVSSYVEKQQLNQKTAAIVLDMETIAIAKVAQQHQVGFLAIRAIADPVTMRLPNAVKYAINAEGKVVLLRLLSYLLFHPAELPALIQLGLCFRAAKKTLTQVATELQSIIDLSHYEIRLKN